MLIVKTLNKIPRLQLPIALTIGTFDGVHLGHQYLLQELKKHGSGVVLTFSNHPSEILDPHAFINLLTPLADKLKLLENQGVKLTILLKFTEKLAQTPYDVFLKDLHASLPFSTLILGEGARLGAKAEGDARKIQEISHSIGFTPIFLPKLKLKEEIISSRRIRELLKNKQYNQANQLLGKGS